MHPRIGIIRFAAGLALVCALLAPSVKRAMFVAVAAPAATPSPEPQGVGGAVTERTMVAFRPGGQPGQTPPPATPAPHRVPRTTVAFRPGGNHGQPSPSPAAPNARPNATSNVPAAEDAVEDAGIDWYPNRKIDTEVEIGALAPTVKIFAADDGDRFFFNPYRHDYVTLVDRAQRVASVPLNPYILAFIKRHVDNKTSYFWLLNRRARYQCTSSAVTGRPLSFHLTFGDVTVITQIMPHMAGRRAFHCPPYVP